MLKVTTSYEVNQRLKNLPLRKKDKPFKFETSWAERGRRCKTTIQVAFINMFSYLPVFTVHSFTKHRKLSYCFCVFTVKEYGNITSLCQTKAYSIQKSTYSYSWISLKQSCISGLRRELFFPFFSSFLPSWCQYTGTSYLIRPSGHLTTVNSKQSVNTVQEINNTTAFVAEVTITLWVCFVLSFFF